MNKQITQAINLMRQHPFYAVVSIVGTAVTVAFIMVVVMIYDFRTADIDPESDRSHLMYTGKGRTARRDNTNVSSGMGRVAWEALFEGLPGVEDATWYAALDKSVCSLPASSERHNLLVRSVAANWFTFFRYDFVAGRSFTQAEYDMGRSAYRESASEFHEMEAVDNPGLRSVVITEHVARLLFGSAAEAVGKVFWIDFHPSTVVGVVRDVSSIFQTAYADAFQPFTLYNEDEAQYWTGGLGGVRLGVLKLSGGTRPDDVRAEVARRETLLNDRGLEYTFRMEQLYTHTDYTFFRDTTVDARLVYVLLIVVLLVVPAVSISGLMNAQTQGRLSEIAVRKAYGASNFSILCRFVGEGLVSTLIGGVAGYALSCLLVWAGRVWLFGSGGTDLSGISLSGSLLFRPALFVAVLCVCFVFNLLSVLLPAWLAVRRPIAPTLKGE